VHYELGWREEGTQSKRFVEKGGGAAINLRKKQEKGRGSKNYNFSENTALAVEVRERGVFNPKRKIHSLVEE